MSALREALSRALARAPHADLGAHEAHVVEALRGALALEAALDCAAIVTSDALHATLGAGCEASHAA